MTRKVENEVETRQVLNLINITKIVPQEKEDYLKTCQKEFYQILSEEPEVSSNIQYYKLKY